MEIRWVGIDSAGDITGPISEIAVWIAHLRNAAQVELQDFLSALFLLDAERVGRHWESPESARSYLWRADFPLESRKVMEERAFQWLYGGSFHIPGTAIFGGVSRGRPRPAPDLDTFVSATASIAKKHNLAFPNSDCIVSCLLEDARFGEQDKIRSSGVSEFSVNHSLNERLERREE
jgi:hypothetical protein